MNYYVLNPSFQILWESKDGFIYNLDAKLQFSANTAILGLLNRIQKEKKYWPLAESELTGGYQRLVGDKFLIKLSQEQLEVFNQVEQGNCGFIPWSEFDFLRFEEVQRWIHCQKRYIVDPQIHFSQNILGSLKLEKCPMTSIGDAMMADIDRYSSESSLHFFIVLQDLHRDIVESLVPVLLKSISFSVVLLSHHKLSLSPLFRRDLNFCPKCWLERLRSKSTDEKIQTLVEKFHREGSEQQLDIFTNRYFESQLLGLEVRELSRAAGFISEDNAVSIFAPTLHTIEESLIPISRCSGCRDLND